MTQYTSYNLLVSYLICCHIERTKAIDAFMEEPRLRKQPRCMDDAVHLYKDGWATEFTQRLRRIYFKTQIMTVLSFRYFMLERNLQPTPSLHQGQ